jgi:hypothetical protein
MDRELPPSDDEVTFERLSEMLAGFMRTQALSVAVNLGVPDAVSMVPTDIAELAVRVGAHEQSLYRLMRFSRVRACSPRSSLGASPGRHCRRGCGATLVSAHAGWCSCEARSSIAAGARLCIRS